MGEYVCGGVWVTTDFARPPNCAVAKSVVIHTLGSAVCAPTPGSSDVAGEFRWLAYL
jgi:hypothetical protein